MVGQKDTKTLGNESSQAWAGIAGYPPFLSAGTALLPWAAPKEQEPAQLPLLPPCREGLEPQDNAGLGTNGQQWAMAAFWLQVGKTLSILNATRCSELEWAICSLCMEQGHCGLLFHSFAGSKQWVLIHSHIRNDISKEGWILFQLCIKFKIICQIKALFTLYLQTLWTQGMFRGMLRTEFGPQKVLLVMGLPPALIFWLSAPAEICTSWRLNKLPQ